MPEKASIWRSAKANFVFCWARAAAVRQLPSDASPGWRGLMAVKSKSAAVLSIHRDRESLFPPRSVRSAWYFNLTPFGRI